MPRLRMSGAIPPFSPYAFMGCTWEGSDLTVVTLTQIYTRKKILKSATWYYTFHLQCLNLLKPSGNFTYHRV
jgi:hypothetical protein